MKKLFLLLPVFFLFTLACTPDDTPITEDLQKQEDQIDISAKNNENGVIHHVSAGTNDACAAFGQEPGCDKSFSLVANMMADGTVKGQFQDGWGNGQEAAHWGIHGKITQMIVEGNQARVLGIVKRGIHPWYGDISGWYFISLLIDNGTSNNDDLDLISGTFVDPDGAYFEFILPLIPIEVYAELPIMQGQVKIK